MKSLVDFLELDTDSKLNHIYEGLMIHINNPKAHTGTLRERYATKDNGFVGIFVAAAIITPTWDPITLTVCALPMIVLYVLTIGAVKLIERGKRKQAERESLSG